MDPEELRRLYHREGKTLEEIGEIYNCDWTTVKYHMNKHGIERRSRGRIPSTSPANFGLSGKGYEQWRDQSGDSTDTVKIHRLLAVSEYGFDAVSDVHVHHESGIPWDNRPDNLTLLAPSSHNELSASEAANQRKRDGSGRFV